MELRGTTILAVRHKGHVALIVGAFLFNNTGYLV